MSSSLWAFVNLLMLAAIVWGFYRLIVFAAGKLQAATQANVQALAQRLGLAVTDKKLLGRDCDWELTGTLSGRPLRYWQYSAGRGEDRHSMVAVSIQQRSAGRLTFVMQRAVSGGLGKIAGMFGAKDMTTGDEVFDAAWWVQTNQPEFLKAALVPEIRTKLIATVAGGAAGSFRLSDGVVSYEERGNFSLGISRVPLEQQVPLLQDLADLADVALNVGRDVEDVTS
jgi:hypothetical protein